MTVSDSASGTDGAPGGEAEVTTAPRPQGGLKWSVVRGPHGSDGAVGMEVEEEPR